MRELKQGTDITDLFEVVITADPDGDGDFYVSCRYKTAMPDNGEVSVDDLNFLSTYVRAEQLQARADLHDKQMAAQALINGGIDNIEAFLEA